MIIEVDDFNFEDRVIKTDFILVDYYADWCIPCQGLFPKLYEVEKETGVKIAKYDVGNNNQYCAHVKSLPTLILYKYGVPIDTIIGSVDKRKIIKMIKENR